MAGALAGILLAAAPALAPVAAHGEEVTIRFLATADPQYENNPGNSVERTDKRALTDATMADLRRMVTADDRFKGVIIAGDLTQNTRLDEYAAYTAAIGADFPHFFDGLGNHDVQDGNCCVGLAHSGYCVCPLTLAGDLPTRVRTFDGNYTTSGPHYAWDWGPVRFYQLNLFADEQPLHPGDPESALAFLERDLKVHRGPDSGKTGHPVVLVQHYCVTPGVELCESERWWSDTDKQRLFRAVLPYNVVAMITGHYHNPTPSRWANDWAALDDDLTLRVSRDRRIPTFITGATLLGRYAEFKIEYDTEAKSGQMYVAYHTGSGAPDCRFVVIGGLAPQIPTRGPDPAACPD